MTNRPISTLLVANRGEIAVRVMRTARALGLRTVAVFSDADAAAPHVRFADDAVRLGPAPVSQSYLNADAIIEAARASGADAIHPGYGFLSENAAFVRAVEAAGLIFVGPTAMAVEVMGDKARAKRKMIEADVPCVPGYEGNGQSDPRLIDAANAIGFPVMVKAAAGGGGRGMRLVTTPEALPNALSLARAEAESAFGSGTLIIEKAIVRPRHVEIQVFADSFGNTVHLGERDCSVQRRHQKVIEEALCPVLTPELRARMGEAAVAAARAVDYRGAGTVEFLLDGEGRFYFLEMNTRLQVEHPVTELVTGLDLVELQLRVAQGERLPLRQEDVLLNGWAIEVRLYAEDPAKDFLPSTGPILCWQPPSGAGIRVDAGIETGGSVSPYYDAMVAKIVAAGRDRAQAQRRLIRALEATALFGLATNRDFLLACLRQPAFTRGEATTAFIAETFGESGFDDRELSAEDYAMAAVIQRCLARQRCHERSVNVHPELLEWSSTGSSTSVSTYATSTGPRSIRVQTRGPNQFEVSIDDQRIPVRVIEHADTAFSLRCRERTRRVVALEQDDRTVHVCTPERTFSVTNLAGLPAEEQGAGGGRVTAPMHGKLTEVFVEPGQAVRSGERLAVLEAMKMHFDIVASIDGTVASIDAVPGSQVSADDLIMLLEAA